MTNKLNLGTLVRGHHGHVPEPLEVKEVKTRVLDLQDCIESAALDEPKTPEGDEDGCCSSCSSCFSGFASTLLAILISPYTFIAWCITSLFCKETPSGPSAKKVNDAFVAVKGSGKEAIRECVNGLLDKGADMALVMHNLFYHKCYDELLARIDAGVDVNIRGNGRQTLLHRLCEPTRQHDRVDGKLLINELMKMGADLNAKDRFGNTPLHMCCMWNAEDAARHLFAFSAKVVADKQVDVDSENNLRRTALHVAVLKLKRSDILRNGIPLIQLLLEHRADVSLRDRFGRTPLHLLCANSDKTEITAQVLELLGKAENFLIGQPDHFGSTALHMACVKGRTGWIEPLVSVWDANLMAAGDRGRTPLHLAAKKGHINVIQAIFDLKQVYRAKALEKDPKVDLMELDAHLEKQFSGVFNALDEDNETPLSLLTRPNDLELDHLYETGKLLIACGATKTSPIDGGRFPEMELFEVSPQEIAEAMTAAKGDSKTAKSKFSTSNSMTSGAGSDDEGTLIPVASRFTKTLNNRNNPKPERNLELEEPDFE